MSRLRKKKPIKKGFWIVTILFWIVIVSLNGAALLIPGFSDWYTDHIMPLWVNSYGRLTGLAGFSVGEILIVAALILILATIIFSILFLFMFRKKAYRRFMAGFYKTDIAIITIVCLIMTLNCAIQYHCSTIDANPEKETRQYTTSELYTLRNYIVSKCNEYSEQIERDEDGLAVYSGDLQQTAKNAMQNISSIYPRLSGYYPDVKPLHFSSLMSQMYMEGYYFPFSMEANTNSLMYITNCPECYCHELSHLHGYLFEDESNFISFLACTQSSDTFFNYSGYMKVLNYVCNAFAPYSDTLNDDQLSQWVTANDLVNRDNIFLTSEMWEDVESEALISTETVSEASDAFTDATLKMNGVSDGAASYSRVVGLLLEYYDGILY